MHVQWGNKITKTYIYIIGLQLSKYIQSIITEGNTKKVL